MVLLGLDESSVPNVFGLGIGGAVLWLGYRLLTRQSDSWAQLVASAREDAAEARQLAEQANARAAKAEAAEQHCRAQLSAMWDEIARLKGEADQ